MFRKLILLVAVTGLAKAQWPLHKAKGVPTNRAGKPILDGPAPRTPDRKPDLSGLWRNPPCKANCPPGTEAEFLPVPAVFMDIGWGLKDGLPYQGWARELYQKRVAANGKDNPDAHCRPIGLVQLQTHPYVRRIMQTRDILAILYEKDNVFRQIYLDGRPLPEDPQPWYYGYSIGKWSGDTLVATSRFFKDDGWLDFRGAPVTSSAVITERFRRPNFGALDLEITVDDPKAYTRPFTVQVKQEIVLDTDVFEFYCNENQKDSEHYR